MSAAVNEEQVPILKSEDDVDERKRSKTMSRKEMARDLRRRRQLGLIDPEEAELLSELAQALGAAPAVGVASCPFDGCDLETLLVAGRAAVSAGGPAKVRAASEAMRARLDREAAKRDIAAALDADLADHRMRSCSIEDHQSLACCVGGRSAANTKSAVLFR